MNKRCWRCLGRGRILEINPGLGPGESSVREIACPECGGVKPVVYIEGKRQGGDSQDEELEF